MTVEQILMATSIALNIDVAEIRSASRKGEGVQARMIIVKLLRDKENPPSWQAIGVAIGNRDHSTAMNNYHNFENDYKINYKGLKDKFEQVKDALSGNQSIVVMATLCRTNATTIQ